MRVMVAGGTGFIGRHVVRRLLNAGMDVCTVDSREPSIPLDRERIVVADLSDVGQIRNHTTSIGSVDSIVWLAAPWEHRARLDTQASADLRLMVESPLTVLRQMRDRPRSVVYFSSIQVYGKPVRLPVDEDHPTDPFTAYGVAKLAAEHTLRIMAGAMDVAVTAFRLGFVYGPGQSERNVIPRFMERARRGQAPIVFGKGDDVRDDIFVGDVALAVELALLREPRGAFNIASGKPHSILDVAEAVCRLAGGGLRPRLEAVESSWVDRWFAVDRAKAAFGFEAGISFEEGLALQWHQERGGA